MTEWTRVIRLLLNGPFSVILKKNTIKTGEVIFHIHLGTQEVMQSKPQDPSFFDDETIFFLITSRYSIGQMSPLKLIN